MSAEAAGVIAPQTGTPGLLADSIADRTALPVFPCQRALYSEF